ncbi:MAG: hypothetical protein P8Z80_20055 [Pseudolabrys sp.]
MVARKEISPELEAKARHLYEQTLAPVDDIAAMLGMSRTTFYRRFVKGGDWANRRASAAQFEFARALTTAVTAEQSEARRAGVDVSTNGAPSVAAPAVDHTALAARLLELVGREMDLIDKLFDSAGEIGPGEVDRTSRTAANLGRSLLEIHEMIKPPREAKENDSDDADADDVPIDIDEFRYELARRINEFVDAERRKPSEAGDPSLGRDDGEEV